jgi:flagellar basal-body rod modification protein FlgD
MTTTSSTSAFDQTLANLGIKRTSTSSTVASASSSNTTLGQSDFLKLMTAQMQNQDPFNPVDNTQMVAQMAQFSSLAGITEMSTTLKAMAEKMGATTASDAMAYVGRTVLTEGSTAYGRTGGGIAGAVELDAAADSVTVQITGANGALLKTLSLGKQAAGTATFDWDGKTDGGEDAGAGPFTVSVNARASGEAVPGRTLVWAPVQSVSVASGTPTLTLPGIGTVPASKVREIG